MNTQEAPSTMRVGVIIVKGGCCGGDTSGPVVAAARSLIEKIGADLGVPLVIKELGGTQAMQGGLPPSLVAQAWPIYRQFGSRMVPAIIMNGRWVSFGAPDETVLKQALSDASRA